MKVEVWTLESSIYTLDEMKENLGEKNLEGKGGFLKIIPETKEEEILLDKIATDLEFLAGKDNYDLKFSYRSYHVQPSEKNGCQELRYLLEPKNKDNSSK